MEALLERQKEIVQQLRQIKVNFSKDSAERKTAEYLNIRINTLDSLWIEFDQNNTELSQYDPQNQPYFKDDVYSQTKISYHAIRKLLSSYGKDEKDTGNNGEVKELLTLQRTNFRAFLRLVKSIKVDEISEKWELDDELKNIQTLWSTIYNMHLKIDNILQGSDIFYDEEFSGHEISYKTIKRVLNTKLCSTAHKQQATPQLEIPIFTGKYTHWPTFYDLFCEAVHNNRSIQKGQKMQHLKGKLRGEAERLIQHLYISAENYDTAWEIITRRYNNPPVLFTQHIEIFLNQPTIHKQSAFELKRMHDVSLECINSIHNLGVDTNTWDPLLVHLLLKKLDSETYSDFKESRKAPRELPTLQEFMDFLENKFVALEPINHKREKESFPGTSTQKGFSMYQKPSGNHKPNCYGKSSYKTYQAVPAYMCQCPLCNLGHYLYKCGKFISMTPENKLRAVLQNKVCQNCLYKHHGNECVSNKRCKECNGKHNTLLHDAFDRPNLSQPKLKSHNVGHVAGDNEEVLLTTILLKVQNSTGEYVTLRALLDQGSQLSLISEKASQLLGLQRHSYHASIAGIGNGYSRSKGVVTLSCQSIYDDYQLSTQALVISKVINNLPNISFNKQTMPHISNIKLADPEYNISKPIDLLLDASVYSSIIMNGLIRNPDQNIIAQQTRLGWILSGNVRTFNCHVVINNLEDISKYWELEDITPTSTIMTQQEQYCEEFYQRTTRRLENGSYEVGLPMKSNFDQQLGLSKPKAVAQFKQLEKKFERNEQFNQEYKQFINEYEKLGHMRQADGANEPSCYLPHHGVLKSNSTTPLRVVFNASFKTSTGHSLNDLMECGPNLQKDLQSLILNWRKHVYVITADIEKMFRTIFIRESDQQLQKIIWRDSIHNALREYQLTTVTYGTKAAPFLAMRTLRQLAKDDAQKYPLAASALESSFYMDDLLTGSNSIHQVKELQQQLIMMLSGAGMNLRKWSSNEPQLIKDLLQHQVDTPLDFKCAESRKTLGLRWNPSSDNFVFQSKLDYQKDIKDHTKRQLLSDISKLFDPLGWLSPITIRAKLLFQRAWASGISWDDQLPELIQNDWNKLREDMTHINEFSISRYLGNTEKPFILHGFCDASEKAFAAVIYIVTINNKGKSISRQVIAKTKLAPLSNKASLPKLELCGAVLLAQLVQKTIDSISFISKDNIKVHAWTDSMVVLGWLQGDISRWKQFVANRVQQVTAVIEPSNWHHVRSEDNAADCATRGLSSAQLSEHSLWWEGPKWILEFNPKNIKPIQYASPTLEEKTHNVNAVLHSSSNLFTEVLERHGSITRIIRIIAWVSRFITLTQRKQESVNISYLRSSELNDALNIIIKEVQGHEFEDEINSLKNKGHVNKKSKILSLNPFLDNKGILRVGGRLSNSNISDSAKHAIILSKHSRLTELIINQGHKSTMHGNARLVLLYLRNKYWIIGGMSTVKIQLRKCVKCRRFSPSNHQQIMADLPAPRVTPSRPFSHAGVDFTGHVELKANKGRGIKTTKGYVAVFVCLSTKAVHLELVSDLSTPTFLAAFKRFCARRGTPRHMYSDNGTNFVGANRLLRKEYNEIIQCINSDFFNNINQMDIEWHFNAPAWPSAGGLWEAAVKSFKYHLKRVLGEQKLTYEEFTTLIQQIEACLNSRPLGPLTENPEDEYLTPGHFLVGGSLLSRPQSDPLSSNLSSRWRLVQTLNKQLWKRWSTEYLQQLQVRTKWRTPSKNLELDDVVLVKEDNLPPGKWALGRVQELHPGKDGCVRVVTLKTQNSIIKRPVSKLAILPVNNIQSVNQDLLTPTAPIQNEQCKSETNTNTDTTNTRKRRGRPIFKGLFMTLFLFISLISPSMQSNVTALNDNQGLYFDNICNLQHIRDEWKLIVYYNMTTYWEALSDVTSYVTHLKDLSTEIGNVDEQYKNIASQMEHEISEIEHYNTLLQYHNSRHKRGLINGIGYVANSLFGVLDERFAKQYEKDIIHITQNENHLQRLIKNQTSIVEAEYNILQRHENIITKQFGFIKEHLTNITSRINGIENTIRKNFYLTSSSLAAYATLSNIRRIQQTLIDTITDLSQGRVDPYLLSPEQLQDQINVISGQLYGDLTLPIDNENVKDIYKLSRIATRVYKNYLIMEIKIPIVSSDIFELDRVISIPQKRLDHMYEFIPISPYIAFNLQKDSVLFLSENDLSSCINAGENKLICSINNPTYNINIKQSICDINIASDANTKRLLCKSVVSTCDNKWIKLRRLNVWLYSCCEECNVRIFCTAGMEVKTLNGNGIIDISHGCTLKTDVINIHSHNNFINQMNVEPSIKMPEISILNHIINSSNQINLPQLGLDDIHPLYHQLRTQIEELKAQSNTQLTVHNVHHYSALYVIIAIILISSVIITYRKVCGKQTKSVDTELPLNVLKTPSEISEGVVKKDNIVISVEKGTSMGTPRVITFDTSTD